jgi:hypothetical protein
MLIGTVRCKISLQSAEHTIHDVSGPQQLVVVIVQEASLCVCVCVCV